MRCRGSPRRVYRTLVASEDYAATVAIPWSVRWWASIYLLKQEGGLVDEAGTASRGEFLHDTVQAVPASDCLRIDQA